MKILVRESHTELNNEAYDAKQVVKIIKDSVYTDFGMTPFRVYYNPASLKIIYDHTLNFLTDEEYDNIVNSVPEGANEYRVLADAVTDKIKNYLSELPIPKNCIKEARVNFGFHGTFQILVYRTLPVVNENVEVFQPFETYSVNDIINARSRVDANWDWEEIMDEAEANDDYVLMAAVELDAIKRFLSVSDKDIKDLSINEDGDYLRVRLRSGETKYFYELGNQLKDKDTGKLIPIHI